MLRKIALLLVLTVGEAYALPGDIFKTWWRGIYVQSFTVGPYACIKGFRALGPDSAGFVYLQAISTSGDSGYVFKTWWRGIKVQSFISSHCIRGFNTSTSGEWVILEAYTGFDSGQILKTRHRGTYVQEFHGDCPIVGLSAREEPGGWIYLSVDTACGILGDTGTLNVEEKKPKEFAVEIEGSSPPRLVAHVPKDGVLEVRLYNTSGRLLFSDRIGVSAGDVVIPLKVGGRGVYMVEVRWGDERRLLKFVRGTEKRR